MKKKIVLGITGSIAAYKACELISLFRKKGYAVRCVMSQDAKRFITPLTLETLSGEKVVSKMFSRREEHSPVHISIAEEADVILVAPATADVISKVASGICDGILECVICSSDCPVIFAPAMNDRMYRNPVIQDKINYLKEKGYGFVGPVEGHLACGTEGIGHIAPLEKIIEETEKTLKTGCKRS